MRKTALLVLLMLLLALPAAAAEAESDPVEIHTVADLLAMAQSPNESYILMADLDMTGVSWSCPAFSGSFDGNGHAILNLRITQPGTDTATSYDGNQKTYETHFAGFFGTLRNATVKNLKLLNVQALVQTDLHCFLGGLAGYSEWSTIEGCTVTGNLELRAHEKMFGVGGIVGYGNGTVRSCTADVTLICTDTDPKTLDEQFLGGVFATGFMNVLDCDITIDGYSSDYGYVHNGGITGMYLQYPIGGGKEGRLTGNRITGKITFFECNADRRAYCRAEAGEVLAFWYTIADNTIDFFRDERWEYDRELRPEMCQSPSYTETVTPSGCTIYGFTTHTCDACGYAYTDCYTPFSHTVTAWTITKEPTTEQEGLSTAACDGCGMVFQRTEPKLEPPPTTVPEPTTVPTTQPEPIPTTAPAPQPPQPETPPILPAVLAAVGAALILLLLFLLRPRKKGGKYLK